MRKIHAPIADVRNAAYRMPKLPPSPEIIVVRSPGSLFGRNLEALPHHLKTAGILERAVAGHELALQRGRVVAVHLRNRWQPFSVGRMLLVDQDQRATLRQQSLGK